MTLDPFMVRVRRALRRPAGYYVRRAVDSAVRRSRRPWSHVLPRIVTEAAVLRALGASSVDEAWRRLASQPFFIQASTRAAAAQAYDVWYPGAAAEIVDAADAVLRHEFNLLGSGARALGDRLPWHSDFKTGRRWPASYSGDIEYLELDRPSDVKVPWELSRCQHFTLLGQAYWLTGDDRYAAEFVSEVSAWIQDNPYVHGVNWACAMDVALRAVSWIWGFHFFADAPACRDEQFRAAFLRSLFLHGEFIASHLERGDVNGNHYLCDGVGLVFLGCFFSPARRAARWLAIGRSIVQDEIFNQTTADGIDFEQSTAYHRLVLEAFLTSYQLLRMYGAEVPPACAERLAGMCEFVQAYTKPDGRAPLFGDADDGRIQRLGRQAMNDHRYLLSSAALMFDRADLKAAAGSCWEETFWLCGPDAASRFDALPACPLEARSAAFPAGGFFVLRTPDTHLVVDCGEVGMRGRGGHGHNDILSFELFMSGRNVISDCGAYVYTASAEWRNAFRSTAFHNTVQVDDAEVNRFVSPTALWQLEYDAAPIDPQWQFGSEVDSFSGGHRGYLRLDPPVAHRRAFYVSRTGPRVLLCDWLDSDGPHAYAWRFHLDPAVVPHVHGGDVRLTAGDLDIWLLPADGAFRGALSLEPGWISPSYGVKVPTTVIRWALSADASVTASFLFAESQLSGSARAAAAALLSRS
ncbi:MAG: hypothetical protein JWL71_4101 [Acidobacteria bacterium]|nr:hypothetical protein [Acidobacteriota bacterium]